MLISVQCGPLRRIHGPAGADLSGNRCSSDAVCQASPESLLPAPRFFLCQRMAHPPPSASALPRARLAAAVCASVSHALTPCASVCAQPSPARLCAPRAGSAAAPMASALRMFTCARAVRCRGPALAVCASVTVPSAPGPCVLRALRVCDCAVRARPAHPRAAARACACPAPACRGPARAIRWPPSVLRSACRRPALASFAPSRL